MSDLTEKLMPGVPVAARWLGLAGLLPFVALSAAVVFGWQEALASRFLAAYGISILSFMGGCRWGFAAAGLGQGPDWAPLSLSVIPSLYAVAVVLLPAKWTFAALAFGFLGLLIADIVLTRAKGAPEWWSVLRLPLSLGAAGALGLAAIG